MFELSSIFSSLQQYIFVQATTFLIEIDEKKVVSPFPFYDLNSFIERMYIIYFFRIRINDVNTHTRP